MFNYKYIIEFQNQETISLFGEGYYCDKKVFWDSHQTQLKDLYIKVLKTEFPIKIIDQETNIVKIINSKTDFEKWMTTNQPFELPSE